MATFQRDAEQENAWIVRVCDPRDEFAKVTVYLDSATTERISAIATALDWDEHRDTLDDDDDPGFAVLFSIKRFLAMASEAAEALSTFHDSPFCDHDDPAVQVNKRLAEKLAAELRGRFELSDF